MVAMVGKYIVYLEKNGLILAHPAGISFCLTQEDAKWLAVLISNWQRAMRMGAYEGEPEAKQTAGLGEKGSKLQVSESLYSE